MQKKETISNQNARELKEIIKFEAERKTFAKVFNHETIMAIHSLATKGYFKQLEFVISTGKEAEVFRAIDSAGNFKTVKIYKINTSNFKHMIEYIEGDERFKKIQKNKREIVFAWTQKEYKNLEKARKAKIRVPLPLAFNKNVLVMEFIGEKGKASPRLKDTKNIDLKQLKEFFIQSMAKMYKADLIHADFSEYNMLVKGKELVIIDLGQGVLRSHPKAREFFERDIKNIAKFLTKRGQKTDYENLFETIKKTAKKA